VNTRFSALSRTFGLVASAALALACSRETTGQKATSSTLATGKGPTLEIYVMSQCPYGVQVEEALVPVRQQLGAHAFNLDIQYIGDGDASNLQSMHGPNEVKGNIAQLCAQKLDPAKGFDFITCQNKDNGMRAVHENWKACGAELKYDEAKLAACIEGDEGKTLLAESFAKAKAKGASGSPTIFLAGKAYEGGRKPRDFVKAICNEYSEGKPEACKNIPEPPVVNATVLSDSRCKECDIKPLEPRLKGILGGLVVKHVDYASDEGKSLYAELTAADKSFKYLPAVLLDANVEKDADGHGEIKRFLKPVGKYQELALGGKFDPTAEICDNKGDDDGDGKVDCADDGCTNQLVCRSEKKQTLEMYVMSQCPYGAKAMIAAHEVAQHFGKDVKFEVHFIGDGDANNLTGMHGPPEVAENIRELCAMTKYPKDHKGLAYLACRSKDYKNDNWQPCAKEAGIDEKVIQACYDNEGKELLAKDYAIAKSLGIGASPTFLGNGRREFNAIASADLQKQFCTDNPGLAGCKDVVKADPAAAAQPAAQCE
jgi:glutaredoxin